MFQYRESPVWELCDLTSWITKADAHSAPQHSAKRLTTAIDQTDSPYGFPRAVLHQAAILLILQLFTKTDSSSWEHPTHILLIG